MVLFPNPSKEGESLVRYLLQNPKVTSCKACLLSVADESLPTVLERFSGCLNGIWLSAPKSHNRNR